MNEIYYKYRVFREQIEFDPDVDYGSAACERLPEFILIKKEGLNNEKTTKNVKKLEPKIQYHAY